MKAAAQFKTLSAEQLRQRLGEFKKELLKLNVQVATGANPASPGKLKQTKKNIARVLGELTQKEVSNQ